MCQFNFFTKMFVHVCFKSSNTERNTEHSASYLISVNAKYSSG